MRNYLVGIAVAVGTLSLVACGGEGQGACDFRMSPNPQNECREYDHSLKAYKAACGAGSAAWIDGPCPGSPPFGCKDASMIQWYYAGTMAEAQARCLAPGVVVSGK